MCTFVYTNKHNILKIKEMTTQQLRVGNKLLDMYNNYVTVSATYLNKPHVLILEKPCFKTINVDVFPITLSELRMKQLGFWKVINIGSSNDYYWTNDIIDITKDMYLSTSSREYSSVSVNCCNKIEYVHQLQNIQYDLKNVELVFNESITK